MIPIETQIFRLIFPPSGSIPLEKLEAVPHIRQHINSIIDLASTEHGIHTPDESAALTARVIELRDTPGPDGKVRTWRTIAEICGTTLDSVRHRYGKGKATIRKSRTVETLDSPTLGVLREKQMPQHGMYRLNNLDQIGHIEPFVGGILASESLQEAEPINPEKPPEQEKKPDEVATIRESRTVEKPKPLDPETLAEVDRMLGEGTGVLDITTALEKKGTLVPWTKIRARAAFLAKMKRREAAPEPEKDDGPEPAAEEPQEAEAIDDRPEPVAISRKELDLRIWDLHRAGKTLEEISDILYDKGLYYSAKSVRIRLLQQGAKL
jgi:hypothetical protein